MGHGPVRALVALTGAAVLLGGLAAPASATMAARSVPAAAVAGDVGARAMTTAQARVAYLDAACPLNTAIAAFVTAEKSRDWPRIQAALRVVSTRDLRAARLLGHPTRPWPADLDTLIAGIRDMDAYSAGIATAMSLAGSLAAYEAMNKTAGTVVDPGADVVEAGQRAVVAVRRHLGLPPTGGCPVG